MGLGTQKNFLLPENFTYFGRFKRYQKNVEVLLSNYSAIKSEAEAIENTRKARRRFVERVKSPDQCNRARTAIKVKSLYYLKERLSADETSDK